MDESLVYALLSLITKNLPLARKLPEGKMGKLKELKMKKLLKLLKLLMTGLFAATSSNLVR